MKFLSILFILNTLYYVLNRSHLILKPNDRAYKSKIKVYSDILYFTSDILYFIWIIIMMFFSFELSSLLILLVFLRWFLLDPFKEKQDMAYVVLKLVVLFTIFIS